MAVQSALRDSGITSTSVTHFFRKAGARLADVSGVAENQIRRLGNWNNNAMEGSYTTGVPREAIRAMAGFPPDRREYFIARNTLQPPEELLRMVFPQIEIWEAKMVNPAVNIQASVSARKFLDFLKLLRVVLLQDIAILGDELIGHPIMESPIFMSPTFLNFKQALLASVSTAVNPRMETIDRVAPEISSTMRTIPQAVVAAFVPVATELLRPFGQIINRVESLMVDIHHATGRFNTTTGIPGPIDNLDAPQRIQTPAIASAVDTTASNQAQTLSQHLLRAPGQLGTVRNAVAEWFDGLNGGQSIVSLDEEHGTAWRKAANTRQAYSRRTLLIERVLQLADLIGSRESIEDRSMAANYMDRYKDSMNWSLDKLQKQLRGDIDVESIYASFQNTNN